MSPVATISWLPATQGGRAALPTGNSYTTIGRFSEDGPSWPNGAWSVVLEFDSPPSEQGNPSVGRARFLVPEAPSERLKPGTKFELYEGPRCVAIVDLVEQRE